MNKTLLIGAVMAFVGAANAQVYTSLGAWQTAISNDPGAFYNSLDGVSNSLSGGSPAITANVTTPSTFVYHSGSFYGANSPTDSVTFTFTGGVRAVGAEWFHTDFTDAFIPGRAVTLTYSDGFVDTYTPAAISDFRGYVSGTVLTSVTVSAAVNTPGTPTGYASVDNIRASTVPEPATMTALGLGAAAMLRRRKKA